MPSKNQATAAEAAEDLAEHKDVHIDEPLRFERCVRANLPRAPFGEMKRLWHVVLHMDGLCLRFLLERVPIFFALKERDATHQP